MDRTTYRVLPGTFVAEGYAPDGDTIRFAPDHLTDLDTMQGTARLLVGRDCTLQVRLEGIDAPELHYDSLAQRLGDVARDALLRAVGFTDLTIEDDFVMKAKPVRGTIASRSIDARGRVIAYAFPLTATTTDVGASLNAMMVREGMAYPLAYDTQPAEHRASFAALARGARRRARGVWQHDHTSAFHLRSEGSIGAHGALIFPKLFRRCVRYVASGHHGGIKRWLETEAGAENDVVMVADRLTRLSALVADAAERVTTRAELARGDRVVFVAR